MRITKQSITRKFLKYSTGIFLLLLASKAFSQNERISYQVYKPGFLVSGGLGYLEEWRNDVVQIKNQNTGQSLTQPNNGYLLSLGLGYQWNKGYIVKLLYSREYIREPDLNQNFWLGSLHLSTGKSFNLGDDIIRFYAGLSSVKTIEMLVSTSQSNGNGSGFDLRHAQNTSYLRGHIMAEFLTLLSGNVHIGIRTRVLSDFNKFGRIDITGVISYSFNKQ